jgi:hypothetical protein
MWLLLAQTVLARVVMAAAEKALMRSLDTTRDPRWALIVYLIHVSVLSAISAVMWLAVCLYTARAQFPSDARYAARNWAAAAACVGLAVARRTPRPATVLGMAWVCAAVAWGMSVACAL